MYIENIRECHIDVVIEGNKKNMCVHCVYWNEFGLYNISMKFPFTRYEIQVPDTTGQRVKNVVGITIFSNEIIVFCILEFGDLCVITIKR